MSVQLIVYPQNYDGTYNAISSSPTEFLVNGISFAGMDSANSYDTTNTSNIPLDVLTNAPPIIVNTWYRYRSISSGTPNLPEVVTGDLVLYSTTSLTLSGIYQKLSNLTIGSQYTFTIDISTPASDGSIVLSAYNGTNFITQPVFSAALSQITHTFTAASTNDTIIISYFNSVSNSVTISNASIQPVIGAIPSGAIQLLENGQVICDLYEDEDLPLTLSVDDFKNVAEKVQSYSKAFNLPATKRNNRIFDHIFEITREVVSVGGLLFNPYKRTKCVLKQDGFILFEGYLRLLDVTDKEGEISYNVNLYSKVIALADTLKDRTFRDLLLEELDHEYVYSNIKNSWTGALELIYPLSAGSFAGAPGSVLTDVLAYPFVDWNHQFYLESNGQPALQNLENSFRPFIKIKYLIDRIFEASEFTYESDFFNEADFNNLYMDFNWGSEINGATPSRNANFEQAFNTSAGDYFFGSSMTKFKLQDNTFGNNSLWDNTDYKLVSDVNNLQVTADYYLRCQNDTGSSRGNSVRISKFNSSGQVLQVFAQDNASISGNQTKTFQGTLSTVLQIGEYIQAQASAPTSSTVKISMSSPMSYIEFSLNNNSSQVVPLLDSLRGELGQWDFLKGLITMFNLVTLVDEDNPNNIIIEPYSDVFIPTATTLNPLTGTTLANRGIERDWTDKIDISEMKLTPLTDLNKKTIFKFVEDDDDYAFNQYKRDVGGHLYGSLNYNSGNEFNLLNGEKEIVAEPFSATVVKPLMSQFYDFIIPSLYSYSANDDTTEGFDNSPRIMYNNGVKTLQYNTYKVPAQNGEVEYGSETDFLQFSNLTEIPTSSAIPSTTIDFHFGECQLLTGVGAPTPNNLFGFYWQPYYNELYNPNTRTMTLKVNLSPADINTFKFNDRVFIKNRVFRVNKIHYKPNDLATVEFILIP